MDYTLGAVLLYRLAVVGFGILFALFSLDLGKVYLSDYIGKKISNRVFSLITRYFGFILIAIGLYFGYQFIDMLWLRNSTGY